MAYKIEEIEGVGPAFAEKMSAFGIKTTDQLLEMCGSAKGRAVMCISTGLSEKQLLKWVNMADLMRISGVGGEYSELLGAAGVVTVKELMRRNAENLAAMMQVVNETKKLTRQVPSASLVAKWVEQAAALDPKISH